MYFNLCSNLVMLMANVAQLVRALVCGTRCREFESHHSPHKKTVQKGGFFMRYRSFKVNDYADFCDVQCVLEFFERGVRHVLWPFFGIWSDFLL